MATDYKHYFVCRKCGMQQMRIVDNLHSAYANCPKCHEAMMSVGKERIASDKDYIKKDVRDAMIVGTGFSVLKNAFSSKRENNHNISEEDNQSIKQKKKDRRRVIGGWILVIFSFYSFSNEGVLPGLVLLMAAIIQFISFRTRSWIKYLSIFCLIYLYSQII